MDHTSVTTTTSTIVPSVVRAVRSGLRPTFLRMMNKYFIDRHRGWKGKSHGWNTDSMSGSSFFVRQPA